MNAPEKGKRYRYLLRPDDTAIIRTGSHAAFKKIAAEVLANRPKPKKGASIALAWYLPDAQGWMDVQLGPMGPKRLSGQFAK